MAAHWEKSWDCLLGFLDWNSEQYCVLSLCIALSHSNTSSGDMGWALSRGCCVALKSLVPLITGQTSHRTDTLVLNKSTTRVQPVRV